MSPAFQQSALVEYSKHVNTSTVAAISSRTHLPRLSPPLAHLWVDCEVALAESRGVLAKTLSNVPGTRARAGAKRGEGRVAD